MALEDAIHSRLTTHAGVAAITQNRVYPMRKPQSEKRACVIYQLISPSREIVGGADSGLAHPRYQFRCVAPSYSEAALLAIQVNKALSRWSGTEAGQTIQASFPEGGAGDRFDSEDDQGMYSRLLDFKIWHLE